MLTYIVTGIVLIAVAIALISGIWKASKYLVIPMQILIALALLFIIVKVFFTSDNVKALNNEIEKSGIVDSQKKMAQNLLNPADQKATPEAEKTDSQSVPTESAKVSAPKTESVEKAQPVKEQEKVSEPAPQPQEKKPLDPIDFM